MDDNLIRIIGVGAAALGALTGLGLSFTALSPLVMGGIIAAVTAPLLIAVIMLQSVKKEEKLSKKDFFFSACCYAASVASGVGLIAAAMAIFSDVSLNPALAGAVIGILAPIVGTYAVIAISFAVIKVGTHVVLPIVELFSSKEQEVLLH